MDEDLPEEPEDKTKPKYKQIDKVSYLSTGGPLPRVIGTNPSQRAGDYVMAWADELEAQSTTINASRGPKSTLAKRGAKDSAAEGDSGTGNALKKIKVEGGGSEDELRRHFEKGTLSKVASFLSLR